MPTFIHLSWVDGLDILLVALIIFYVFRLIRGSQAASIFISIVALFALRIVAAALNMKLMSGLLGAVLDVGLLALIVIFQPEIRRFLSTIGSTYKNATWLTHLVRKDESAANLETINEICKACEEMSQDKCGALIVMRHSNPLKYYEDTGDVIDAKVSKRLLMNLFFKNSPLHDGAVIIAGDRVVAARCTLPITQRTLPAHYGMRHKAACGISEETDAVVIIVSEETGRISVARHGEITTIGNINDLKRLLQNNE